MVQRAATANEHQVDSCAGARWGSRHDDQCALSARPLEQFCYRRSGAVMSCRALSMLLTKPDVGHDDQPIRRDGDEPWQRRVRHEPGKPRLAEATVIDCGLDGLLEFFYVVG